MIDDQLAIGSTSSGIKSNFAVNSRVSTIGIKDVLVYYLECYLILQCIEYIDANSVRSD